MNDLSPLVVATGDYAHVAALRAAGELACGSRTLPLRWHLDRPGHIFHAALQPPYPYDIAEMSLSTMFIRCARGEDDFAPLPLFPSRMFRHSSVYLRRGLPRWPDEPLRVGAVRLTQTATIWVRGDLGERHGLDLASARWLVTEPPSAGTEVHDVRVVAGGTDALEAMLEAGELDLLIAVRVPAALAHGSIERLEPDPFRCDREALQRLGYVPPMHTIAVRRSCLQTHRGLASAVMQGFESAKRRALDWLLDQDASALPVPLQHAWLDAVDAGSADPWPYGLDANRAALGHFADLLHAQGMTPRRVDPGEVFAPIEQLD